MPRGGSRPGAGKPKGYKHQKTLDKDAAREFVRQRVIAALGPLVDAQITNAQGLKYLVTRDKKTGKFVRVTEAMARIRQQDTEQLETIEIWEKDPSVYAFSDLLNRALDKPKEQVQEITHSIGEAVMAILNRRKEQNRATRAPESR